MIEVFAEIVLYQKIIPAAFKRDDKVGAVIFSHGGSPFNKQLVSGLSLAVSTVI
jgi:hypothetical protein